VRFKIDENLPVEVAAALRAKSHDAVSVEDQGLGGAPDSRIAEVCASENRCLLTLDTDFPDIRSYPPGSHSGIVVLRLAAQDKSSVLAVVARLIRTFQNRSPEGALWVVDESKIRIREST
jgi:predicted nuclease of predicted toxin-antitoxin system